MKVNEQQATTVPRNAWIMLVLIGFCAAGAGVSGTLLWLQSRPVPAATVAVPAPATAAAPAPGQSGFTPVSPVPDASPAVHEPPASLTAGLTSAQAALTLGNWYYDHERWPVAIDQYQRAIVGGMDNPNIRTDLGNCYRFAGEPAKALVQYRLAQKQDPQHEQSLFNQGGLYFSSLHNPAKALAIWRDYLKRFPQGLSAGEAQQLIRQAQTQLAADRTPQTSKPNR